MFTMNKIAGSLNWRNEEIKKEEVVLIIPESEGYKREEVLSDFIKVAKGCNAIKSRKPALANYWDKEIVLAEMQEHDIIGMIKNRVAAVADIVLLKKQRNYGWSVDKVRKTIKRLIEKDNFILLLPSEHPEVQTMEINMYKEIFPNARIIRW